MQIARTQSQPSFKANIKTFNTIDAITRLSTDEFTHLIGQLDRVQSEAPKKALLGLHFDPTNAKPWGVSCATKNQPQMLHPLIFGLSLDDIAAAAKKVIDKAAQKDQKAPYHLPLEDNAVVRFLKKRHLNALQHEQKVQIFGARDIANCLPLPALRRFRGQVEQVKKLILPNGNFAIGFDTKAMIPFVAECRMVGKNNIPVSASAHNVLNLQVAQQAQEARRIALEKSLSTPVHPKIDMSHTELSARQDLLHTIERG